MPRIPFQLEAALRFLPQKHAEFERLMTLEYPECSLEKDEHGAYNEARTQKLWTFWLQAYHAGKDYLEIERPDEDEESEG